MVEGRGIRIQNFFIVFDCKWLCLWKPQISRRILFNFIHKPESCSWRPIPDNLSIQSIGSEEGLWLEKGF